MSDQGTGWYGRTQNHRILCWYCYILSNTYLGTMSPGCLDDTWPASFPGSDKIAILFDQWLTCEGHWRQSSLFLQLKTEKRFRKRGARKWLTESELAMRYGSTDMARKIVQAKLDDPDMQSHVRPHPDCPHGADPKLIFSPHMHQLNFNLQWLKNPGDTKTMLALLALPLPHVLT